MKKKKMERKREKKKKENERKNIEKSDRIVKRKQRRDSWHKWRG